MATLGENYPTLLEVSKEFGVNGEPLSIAEMLFEDTDALDDVPFYEANSTGGHRIAVGTGLPEAVYRKLNAGILPSKGSTADVTESMGSLTSLGKVDRLLADLSGNVDVYRLRKNRRHMQAVSEKWLETLFYGDTNSVPESFLGLAPRYSDITGPENAQQIIDAGGTGTDNFSMWLVRWGPGGVYGIYPKGSTAGLKHEDYGVELCLAPDGVGELPMYRDWFEMNGGIAVEDWRSVVRVANIDTSELTKDAATGADIIDLMIQAEEQLGPGGGRTAWYVPGRVRTFLRRQILNRSNVLVSTEEIYGRRVTAVNGVPVRKVDKLLPTEERVV